MDLDLSGRVAVVTGGSRGLGRAAAQALAEEGASVVVVARGEQALEATAAEISDVTGQTVVPVVADTSSDDSVNLLVDRVLSEFSRVDILVNCAARPNERGSALRWREVTAEALLGELNTKLMGYIRCIRGFAPGMTKRRWGRIINMSGGAARHVGSTIGSVRNASVVAMTKNFAHELGPHGVNVVAIHPGVIYTERSLEYIAEYASEHEISVEEAQHCLYETNDLQRTISASDVGSVVAFLASPRAVGITGDVVSTGGGTERAIFY